MDLRGTVEVVYVDSADGASLRLALSTDEGRYGLHVTGPAPALVTGTPLRVRGRRLPGLVIGDHGGNAGAILAAAEDLEPEHLGLGGSVDGSGNALGTLADTLGEQRTLVILVNFQDAPADQPWSLAGASSVVYGEVSGYLEEASFGATWLQGEVHGWYTLAQDSTLCDSNALRTLALAAAVDDGVALEAFDRVIFAFPGSPCGYSGMATLGGKPSYAWLAGHLDLRVTGHELGHNLGLRHAHFLDCGAEVLGASCTSIEYGDPTDLMGGLENTGHFQAASKEQLGWLAAPGAPTIGTATASGVFPLEPYAASPAGGDKGLRIHQGSDPLTGGDVWYYLEYRQPVGADSGLAATPGLHEGVLLRRVAPENGGLGAWLLDGSPASASTTYGDLVDAALVVGASFTDAAAGITLTLLSADASGAQVEVNLTGATSEPPVDPPAEEPPPLPAPEPAPVNMAPVAVDDGATIPKGGSAVIDLLANDHDPDGDPISVVAVGAPAHGEVQLDPGGTLTYIPSRKFTGEEVFVYTIGDGDLEASAMVRIAVVASGGGGKGGGKGGR
ncbi:MAG: Ig-like domain-containing protein [Deltaproteobacteria bacterium]|nr:Ig-like domain-containing protein [Deltaproteobacteria bacterium]